MIQLFFATLTTLAIGIIIGALIEKHTYKEALIRAFIDAYASNEDIIYEDEQHSFVLKVMRFKVV